MSSRGPLAKVTNRKVWLIMVGALAVHVADEALTGFLPFYNAQVMALRERLGFFPAPTFTFPIWLGGLATAIAIGAAISGIVSRGGRVIRVVTGMLGVLMVGNACGHMFGSFYAGRLLPGFWSSPLLLVSSVWVVTRAIKGDWSYSSRNATTGSTSVARRAGT